jgi:DNA polymerase-3 subunit beta
MKFSIRKHDFREVLSKVQGLTGRKTNLAITETVLITATDDSLTVMATDLETGFEGTYPASVETEGAIAISARKLYEIIREFPAEEIQIHEVENRWIEIRDENVEYHIVGMNPEEFQHIPPVEDVTFYEMDGAALKRMIERTSAIVGAPDDKRSHIIGVYFEGVEGENDRQIRLVSTDGSRLAKTEWALPPEAAVPTGEGVLIPKKGLQEVARFMGSGGTVRFGFQENHFIVRKGGETITIRLLEGDFPRYGEIIDREGGNAIEMDRQLFMMMLRRMSILVTEQYKGVIFEFDENTLTITATNPDIGESKEEMEIDYEAAPIEMAFNPRFFLETLSAIEDDRVILNILDGRHPCIVRGETDETYLSAIMPMKI